MSDNFKHDESKHMIEESCEVKYKELFDGTKQLFHCYKDNDLQIINNMRQFKKFNKEEMGYEELFPTEDQQIFGGISGLISFLYPPNKRGYKNRIGFRYYKENPLTENKNVSYFTLITVDERKFQILEKQAYIYDNKGKTFYKEDLDCLNIILNIITNKINQDNYNLTYPSSTCEILGFIFAIKYSKKKINNIEILAPYYPSPFIPKSMEECDHEIDPSKVFIEPILCNEHASILLFCYKRKREDLYMRKNIIIDMSSIHYNSLCNNDPIFLEEMWYNLTKFPKQKIQMGRSCSMWFYSSMLYLIENKITFPLKNKDLHSIIQKIYELFNIPKDINEAKISEREYENIDKDNFISYKMAFKTFINIEEVLQEFDILTNMGPDSFEKYQKIFYELKTNINLVELNYKYYYKYFKQEILNLSVIRKMKDFMNNVESFFGLIIEAKKDIYLNKNSPTNYNSIIEKNKEISQFSKDMYNNIESFKKCLKSIKLSLLSKEKLHQLFADSSDSFLNIYEN